MLYLIRADFGEIVRELANFRGRRGGGGGRPILTQVEKYGPGLRGGGVFGSPKSRDGIRGCGFLLFRPRHCLFMGHAQTTQW